MSLNWNISKCNRKATGRKIADCRDDSHEGDCKKCPQVDERLVHDESGQPVPWRVTNALIWTTMGLDMGEITEKNAAEFYARMILHDRMTDSTFLTEGNGKPRPITFAEVRAHIGLSTNVTTKTRRQFLARIGEYELREIERDALDSIKPKEAASAA